MVFCREILPVLHFLLERGHRNVGFENPCTTCCKLQEDGQGRHPSMRIGASIHLFGAGIVFFSALRRLLHRMVTAPNLLRYFPRFLFLDSSSKGVANVCPR